MKNTHKIFLGFILFSFCLVSAAQDMQFKEFPIKHLNVMEMSKFIESHFPGRTFCNEKENILVIKGTEQELEQFTRLLKLADLKSFPNEPTKTGIIALKKIDFETLKQKLNQNTLQNLELFEKSLVPSSPARILFSGKNEAVKNLARELKELDR